jgi:hypothetical protein
MKAPSAIVISALALLAFAWPSLRARTQEAAKKDLNKQLQQSLKDNDVHESWIYNDMDAGFAEAKKTGKPLLVVFR